ncbi:MAG: hypothetical protein AAB268_10645 [Elusimicrobiota bacterium]
MDTPEQDIRRVREKRTILLLVGGAASLILPLLGILYIKMREAKTAPPSDGSVMFDRRENGDSKVNISHTVTIMNRAAQAGSSPSSLPPAGGMTMTPAPGSRSSLDFVKDGANHAYSQDKSSAAPAPAASALAAPVAPAAPAPKTVAKKGDKKIFTMPKLQGTKGFTSFTGASPKPTGGQGMSGVAAPQVGNGDADMADLLKNVPGGVNNPEVQKYLKSQGK